MLKKNKIWKIIFKWKITKFMLKAIVSKSILYVYQNVRWNQKKKMPPK